MVDSLEMTADDRAIIVRNCAAVRGVAHRRHARHRHDGRDRGGDRRGRVGQDRRAHRGDGAVCVRQLRRPVQPRQRTVVRAGAAARRLRRDERPAFRMDRVRKNRGTGVQAGNFPQAFSHVGLIKSALKSMAGLRVHGVDMGSHEPCSCLPVFRMTDAISSRSSLLSERDVTTSADRAAAAPRCSRIHAVIVAKEGTFPLMHGRTASSDDDVRSTATASSTGPIAKAA